MLYDFRFPRPALTEFCFRFVASEREGPFSDGPYTNGEVRVWLFVNEQWYGPYGVGIATYKRVFIESLLAGDEGSQLGLLLRQSIFDCKHRLMDVQRTITIPAEELTGKQLIDEYYRRYPLPNLTSAYDPVRT